MRFAAVFALLLLLQLVLSVDPASFVQDASLQPGQSKGPQGVAKRVRGKAKFGNVPHPKDQKFDPPQESQDDIASGVTVEGDDEVEIEVPKEVRAALGSIKFEPSQGNGGPPSAGNGKGPFRRLLEEVETSTEAKNKYVYYGDGDPSPRFYVDATSAYPYWSTGVLWIDQTNNKWCTASVFSTRLLITQGSCYFDTATNTWTPSANMKWCPGVKNGVNTYGCWNIQSLYVSAAMYNANAPSANNDWGVVVLASDWAYGKWGLEAGITTVSSMLTTQLRSHGYPSCCNMNQYCDMCTPFASYSDYFIHKCDFESGDNGGPLEINGGWISGIHTVASWNPAQNYAYRIQASFLDFVKTITWT